MKKTFLFFGAVIILITILSIKYHNRKTDIYITLTELEGYKFQFDNSVIQNIDKMNISQEGKLSYQRWEIDIDSEEIEITTREKLYKKGSCSPYFIIYNYGWNRDLITNLNNYRLFIIKWENNEPYILPVKNINFITE